MKTPASFPVPQSTATFRGEEHSRLELSFCARDGKLGVRYKVLGVRRHLGTGALAITEAAKDIVMRACTLSWGGPPRSAAIA